MKILLFIALNWTQFVFAQNNELSVQLEAIRQKYELPALSAALLQDGALKDISAVGVRKVGREAKMSTEDKIHLGSCTKSMTATLVATFVEEGKLSWDTKLSSFFPEIKLHPDYENVTVAMLLAHRSGMHRGFVDYHEVADEFRRSPNAMEDRRITSLHMLRKKPLHVPDSTDHYSNVGYVIAAHILERLSKKSWEQLIFERIFIPLDMVTCDLGQTSNPEEKEPTQPWGHYRDNSKGGVLVPLDKDNPEMWGPAGRVHCNMRDWAKYLQIHLDGFNGKDSILKSETFKTLHNAFTTSQINYTAGGWFRLERQWAQGSAMTHNGTNLVNYARVWLAPKKNAAIMVFSNMGGDESFSGKDETLNQTGEATDKAVDAVIDLYLRDIK